MNRVQKQGVSECGFRRRNSSLSGYAFGMAMPERQFSLNQGYRFGFNGKENEGDWMIDGYDFGARIYDPLISVWFSREPRFYKYPYLSPYVFASNNPISLNDPDGNDPRLAGIVLNLSPFSSMMVLSASAEYEWTNFWEPKTQVINDKELFDNTDALITLWVLGSTRLNSALAKVIGLGKDLEFYLDQLESFRDASFSDNYQFRVYEGPGWVKGNYVIDKAMDFTVENLSKKLGVKGFEAEVTEIDEYSISDNYDATLTSSTSINVKENPFYGIADEKTLKEKNMPITKYMYEITRTEYDEEGNASGISTIYRDAVPRENNTNE